MSQATVSAAHTAAAEGVISLRPKWPEIIEALIGGGTIRARTESGGVSVEQTGAIADYNLRGEGRIGSVVQDDLDLRFLFRHWAGGLVHPAHTTVDFIDTSGGICASIHAADDTARGTIESLAERFAGAVADAPAAPAPRPTKSDADVDAGALLADWRAMQNVHHFEALLGKHGLGRLQALRLVGPEFARELAPEAFGELLAQLGGNGQEIMVFVANRGMVQIFSGPAGDAKRAGHGWEITHGAAKLYFPDTALHGLWLVHKPTAAGIITSLEFVRDDDDQAVASIFGRHPHGDAQPTEWLALLEQLPKA